jgi:excisionase family DNA binding protein
MLRVKQGGRMDLNEWNSDLMTVEEIAHVLHVPISWIYGRTRRRGNEKIPHIKLGKYLRFELMAVKNWAHAQRAA